MTTKDRLLKYIEYTGLATSRFESLCGLSNGYVRNLKSQIGEDKLSTILNAFPELSKIWLLTGEGSMLVNTSNTSAPSPSSTEEKTARVPLIPFEARGGQLDGFARNGVTLAQCETVPTPFKGAQYAISVRGQSMSPTYPSGCVLFISKNIADWVEWGKVYVLDTENGVIVKQLAPSTRGNDFVCCKSFNDAPEFAPFDVPKSTIFGIYRVVGALIET
jgi:putative phage repressor